MKGSESSSRLARGRRASLRARVYRLLADAFLYPDEDLVSSLRGGGFEGGIRGWMAGDPGAQGGKGVRGLETLLSHPASSSLAALREEHARTFGHTISGGCPPYETEYGSAHIYQQAGRLADIGGFYRAFGLEVSEENPERLDHIGLELEFMSFLALKEAYALEHHGEEKADLCLEAQRRFLLDYLGRWTPLFLRLLRKKGGFYGALAEVAEDFLGSERKGLGVSPEALTEFVPAGPEPGAECDSCPMANPECGI